MNLINQNQFMLYLNLYFVLIYNQNYLNIKLLNKINQLQHYIQNLKNNNMEAKLKNLIC